MLDPVTVTSLFNTLMTTMSADADADAVLAQANTALIAAQNAQVSAQSALVLAQTAKAQTAANESNALSGLQNYLTVNGTP